jgi:hypothetical protein
MPVTTFKRTRTSKTGKKIVETVRRKGAATSANVKPSTYNVTGNLAKDKGIAEVLNRKGAYNLLNRHLEAMDKHYGKDAMTPNTKAKSPKKITKVEVGPYVKGKHAYHLAPKK